MTHPLFSEGGGNASEKLCAKSKIKQKKNRCTWMFCFYGQVRFVLSDGNYTLNLEEFFSVSLIKRASVFINIYCHRCIFFFTEIISTLVNITYWP